MAQDWPDALQLLTGYTWSSRPSPPQWKQTSCTQCASLPQPASESFLNNLKATTMDIGVFSGLLKMKLLNILVSLTLPSLSVLQALITSLPEQKSSKQCCLLRSVTSLICQKMICNEKPRILFHQNNVCQPRCSQGELCPWAPYPWWIQNSRDSCRWGWTNVVSSSYT